MASMPKPRNSQPKGWCTSPPWWTTTIGTMPTATLCRGSVLAAAFGWEIASVSKWPAWTWSGDYWISAWPTSWTKHPEKPPLGNGLAWGDRPATSARGTMDGIDSPSPSVHSPERSHSARCPVKAVFVGLAEDMRDAEESDDPEHNRNQVGTGPSSQIATSRLLNTISPSHRWTLAVVVIR